MKGLRKVFVNNKPLVFADVYEDAGKKFAAYAVVSDAQDDFDSVYSLLKDDATEGVVYLSDSPDQAWHAFIKKYVLSEAAGGVVRNEENEVLIIYRKNRWDLPKGKLDYDESPEGAAVREIEEECGLVAAIERPLKITFHTYTEKNRNILKKTHWFVMRYEGDDDPVPQAEEQIEKALWMSRNDVEENVFRNTYASISEVLKEFFGMETLG